MIKSSSFIEKLTKDDNTARVLNGYVMHMNTPVVRVTNDECEILNTELCPFYLLRTRNIRGWIESRSIDFHRTNSRILRKAIRLFDNKSLKTELDAVLYSKCVTITDNYWFRENGSTDTFESVKLLSDKFADLALTGRFKDFNKIDFMTPELTNIGSYEKCWRNINNDWYMYKASTDSEKFSEILVSKLGEELGLDMAEYVIDLNYPNVVVTRDFTENGNVDFEPMSSIIGDKEDDFEYNVDMLRTIPSQSRNNNEDIIHQYLDILFMDAICFNIDRHSENYGIIRSTSSGLVIGMAPNFDNNLSLISRVYDTDKTMASKVFLQPYIDIFNYCPNYTIPQLERNQVLSIADFVNEECMTNFDSEYVADFVINNYNYIISNVSNDFRYC